MQAELKHGLRVHPTYEKLVAEVRDDPHKIQYPRRVNLQSPLVIWFGVSDRFLILTVAS